LAAEFKAFEEAAPDGFDRGGIGFPLFVQILQERGIAGVAEAAEGGGGGGGGAVGIQPVEYGQGRVRLGRGLKVANHAI
jgi:hypothetical protein